MYFMLTLFVFFKRGDRPQRQQLSAAFGDHPRAAIKHLCSLFPPISRPLLLRWKDGNSKQVKSSVGPKKRQKVAHQLD